MYVTGLDIERLPPLDSIRIDCDNRANLFIGPNASGKSTILRLINSIQFRKTHYFKQEGVTGFFKIQTEESALGNRDNITVDIDVSDDWLPPSAIYNERDNTWEGDIDYTDGGCPVPISYIPATRVGLTARRNIFDNAFPNRLGKELGGDIRSR